MAQPLLMQSGRGPDGDHGKIKCSAKETMPGRLVFDIDGLAHHFLVT